MVVSVSQGTLNEALAQPREVFKPVIAFSAYAFIMVHNHVSLLELVCGLLCEKILRAQSIQKAESPHG
jgi:hypothetical protein